MMRWVDVGQGMAVVRDHGRKLRVRMRLGEHALLGNFVFV